MNLNKRKIITSILLILYLSLIWALSSISQIPKRYYFYGIDKIAHIILYSGLGAIIYNFIRIQKPDMRRKKVLLFTIILGTFYGLIDELHQYYVPGRTTSLSDLISDSIGITIGSSIIILFENYYKKKKVVGYDKR